ncbi:MAG: MBL fold metallo-hydrolase [Deltaproteobacteria bacterium]|nr:MBL fold metallo-hydrolase [Deltaproteobacteria bacterium]
MILESLETGPLAVNCYIIGDDAGHEAVVVDPGGNVSDIKSVLARNELVPKLIINTHAHFDHVGGNKELSESYDPHLPIAIHPAEAGLITQLENMASMFGVRLENSPPAERMLKEGDIIRVGVIELQVLETPGHSSGSISLVVKGEDMVIVGDLLFAGSIGRTDFPGGDLDTLLANVKEKIFTLGDDVKVLPGHGPATTVGRERRFNPFFGTQAPLFF